MKSQIKQWGNSQGIRIPKEVMEDANMLVNDIVDISTSDGKIIIKKTFKHKTLEERSKEYNNTLILDGEIDWGEPQGREIW